MRKTKAEPAIRHFIGQWLDHKREAGDDLTHPSYLEFRD